MKLTRIELAGIIFVSVILVTRIEDEDDRPGRTIPAEAHELRASETCQYF